jgi:hypothetical protein
MPARGASIGTQSGRQKALNQLQIRYQKDSRRHNIDKGLGAIWLKHIAMAVSPSLPANGLNINGIDAVPQHQNTFLHRRLQLHTALRQFGQCL